MSLEKIINGIKKAACITLATIALASGSAKATDEYEIIRLSNFQIGNIGLTANVTSVYNINNQGEVAGCVSCIPITEEQYKKPFIYNLCNERIFSEFKNIPESFFGYAKAISNPSGRGHEGRFVILEEQYKDHYGNINFLKSYIIDIFFPSRCLPPFICDSHTFPLEFKAQDINSGGAVVGENYLYAGGTIINLCPDSNACEAHRINDNNIIVGCSKDSVHSFLSQPVFWESVERGEYKKIKLRVPEPWDGGCALDINKKRQIIGYLLKDCGRFVYKYSPCLWDGENVTELSPLTQANAINDLGQIVGTIDGKKAVLWEKEVINGVENGVITDLNEFIPPDSNAPADWDYLYEAVGINDNGQIIGYGYLNYDKGAGRWRMPYPFLMNKKDLEGDLNKDGIVNLRDLSELANHWLEER
jgi:hypothetical protein